MPLGFTDEQGWAHDIAEALERIARNIEDLIRMPGGDDRPRYPELREVAGHVVAAAETLDAGVKKGSLSRDDIAKIGEHFETAGRRLRRGGTRRV